MSHLLDPLPTIGRARRDLGRAFITSVARPFEAPVFMECDEGASIGAIIDALIAEGALERAWEPYLQVYVDGVEIYRAGWGAVKPKAGAILSVRAQPGVETIIAFVIDFAIQVAIAAVVSYAVNSFVGSGPEAQSFEQIKDIDASRNEMAPFRKVAVVLGKMRVFPPFASKSYTIGDGERTILRMLFAPTIGKCTVANLKVGDTPLASFTGASAQTKLAPGAPYPTLFPNIPDEQDGAGVLLYADPYATITTDASDVNEIHVELLFTKGLIFYSGDGGIKPYGVQFWIRYREVGSGTWLDFDMGSAFNEATDFYALSGYRQRKPFRMTFKRTGLASAQYEVSVRRKSVDDPGPKGMNEFAWSKLRTFTYGAPVQDDNIALIAVEIEATDQIAGIVDLVNAEVHSVAPKWNAETETFDVEGETSNPAELVRWIATGVGAARPRDPVNGIDVAKFGEWAELCTARGWECNMELRAGAGQDEIMETVARCGRATLVERGGKLAPVIDDVQPAPVQKFNARNSWSFRARRRFMRETHAFRCQFNNEEKAYVRDEMIVYFPGYDLETAELIETVAMVGKTAPLEVYQSALRMIAEELLRPEEYTLRCDVESLTVQRGYRVTVAHPVIAVGIKGARVKARTLNGGATHVLSVTLDEQVVQTPGDTYALSWRKLVGGVISNVTDPLTNLGVTGNVVQFAAEGGLPIASAPKVGDLVDFGEAGIETLDVMVQNVSRATDYEGEIMAVPYSAALFDGDLESLPPWSSNVSSAAFPRPPAPIILSARADSTGIFIAYDFPVATAMRVDSVELWWRQDIDAQSAFEYVGSVPASGRIAAFPPGEGGFGYECRLVSVGAIQSGQRTVRTASDIVSIASAAIGNALTGFLTNESHTVATAADGTGGSFTSAGGFFKLFRGDVDISNGADPDLDTSYEVVAGSVTSGLTIAIDADTGAYTISALTVDQAVATLRASNQGRSVDAIYSIAKSRAGAGGAPGAPGANGGDAQTIRLSATSQQFTFDPENNASPAAQSITLSVARQNVPSGSVVFTSSPSVTLGGSGDTRTLSVADFGANNAVEITATLGALTDKITIVRTRAGGNLFTTTRTSTISLTGRALKKESGSAAWDAQAYSNESFVGGAFCGARPAQTNAAVAFGLNTDPTTDANISSLDYAWYLRADGNCEVYAANVKVWPASGTQSYATTDVFTVVYDGAAIRFYQGGLLRHEIAASSAQLRLYLDSSFNTVGAQLNDVTFGPTGAASTRSVTIWTRSVSPPATPTGDAPSGWDEAIPAGDVALWSSTGTFTQADVLVGAWSAPVLRSSPNYRGAYAAGTAYYIEDSVTYNGGTYKLIVASSTGNAPSGTAQDNAWWLVLAAPGAPGEPGTPPSGYSATIDLTSITGNINLRSIADANGYTGLSDATITFEVESGVTIQGLAGSPSGGDGITTGTWPTSEYAIALTLTIKSGAIVRGGGGKGGNANSGKGGDGGDAIKCQAPITININSGAIVQGGGGGGGAGARDRIILGGEPVVHPGGGGGGGRPNGVGGAGTLGTYEELSGDGGDASPTANGTGGAGYSSAGDGGAGGSFGANGTNGQTAYTTGGLGGYAGYCVRKNGFTVPVTNAGTTAGTIG